MAVQSEDRKTDAVRGQPALAPDARPTDLPSPGIRSLTRPDAVQIGRDSPTYIP